MEKLIVFLLFSVIILSCKKECKPTIYPNLLPMKVGNFWVYQRGYLKANSNQIDFYTARAFDSSGTFIGFVPRRDTIWIEKDTMINSMKYFKFRDTKSPYYSWLRDSLHYIVNHFGRKILSSQNFVDTLWTNTFIQNGINYTSVAMMYKDNVWYARPTTPARVPAGQFNCYLIRESFQVNKKVPINLFNDKFYAENIGIIRETRANLATQGDVEVSELISYKIL